MTGEKIMVRVGGGFLIFEEYIPLNIKFHQQALLVHMLKSKLSLE